MEVAPRVRPTSHLHQAAFGVGEKAVISHIGIRLQISAIRFQKLFRPRAFSCRGVIELAEAEKHCACCSQDLRPIGGESSERYEYIPAQLLVIEDVCKKYACACTVKTAGQPPQPIEKSVAGASLLAQVIVSKIADHLPVHRQAKIFSRFGVEIPDQT